MVTQFHVASTPNEHARNLFTLSEVLDQSTPAGNDSQRAGELRTEAKRLLRAKNPGISCADREDDYNQFVPIFWR